MSLDRAINFFDLQDMAKRCLPKIVFDFVEGGADCEHALARNRAAFQKYTLLPRYLVDMLKRSQSVTVFGRRYDSPFGFSPTGLAGLVRPGVDLMEARAAAEANIPYLMSSASNDSIEAAAKIAPNNTWFQMYGTANDHINTDLVRRARDLGLETLVLTVDVPVNSNRERNRRNGFTRPLKMTPSIVLDSLRHPAWIARFLSTGGIPMMQNWLPYAPPGASVDAVADMYGTLTPAPSLTWKTLDTIRALWPGNLVLKGILNPDDAIKAVEAGVNGLLVSNHGGRQLDAAPSPLQVLPAIKAAVGERAELFLDSGIRRGSDVLIALALGAKLALFGRPPIYAAAVAGQEGVRKVVAIMRREIDAVMVQIGCPNLSALDASFVLASGEQPAKPDR